ncbi:hypothetical protein MUO66_09520, partial [Candidatus Bathyarchaeota archaeon]|nr:hypothetical protein [Candidatus Bathyarchaeota archaeon]
YDTYKDKCLRIRTLYWEDDELKVKEEKVSLYNGVPGLWTESSRLINYSDNTYSDSTNITGFANAIDDAVQVLEFIHSSDLIVYSPYFVADDE